MAQDVPIVHPCFEGEKLNFSFLTQHTHVHFRKMTQQTSKA